jgi:hypothetical protein
MSTPNNSTTEYMLLSRGDDWDKKLSQAEAEQVIERLKAWFEKLEKQGVVKGGQALARIGRTVSGKGGQRTVADGPFAETKEAVGGYLVVQVKSIEEAVAIARGCPTLDYGIEIEVRPVLEECPCFKRVRERRELATA